MCGIVGIFAYHNSAPPVDAEEALKMREAMRPRGADGGASPQGWIISPLEILKSVVTESCGRRSNPGEPA